MVIESIDETTRSLSENDWLTFNQFAIRTIKYMPPHGFHRRFKCYMKFVKFVNYYSKYCNFWQALYKCMHFVNSNLLANSTKHSFRKWCSIIFYFMLQAKRIRIYVLHINAINSELLIRWLYTADNIQFAMYTLTYCKIMTNHDDPCRFEFYFSLLNLKERQ